MKANAGVCDGACQLSLASVGAVEEGIFARLGKDAKRHKGGRSERETIRFRHEARKKGRLHGAALDEILQEAQHLFFLCEDCEIATALLDTVEVGKGDFVFFPIERCTTAGKPLIVSTCLLLLVPLKGFRLKTTLDALHGMYIYAVVVLYVCAGAFCKYAPGVFSPKFPPSRKQHNTRGCSCKTAFAGRALPSLFAGVLCVPSLACPWRRVSCRWGQAQEGDQTRCGST